MKRRFFRTRKTRFAGISVILTVLVIVSVILVNSVFGSLATQYEWMVPMNAEANYDVTSLCYRLLDNAFASAARDTQNKRTAPVQIIFCDTEEMWSTDTTQSYLYHTAMSLDERYEKVTLEFHDILLNPDSIRKYAKTTEDGEKLTFSSTDVIVSCEDYFRVYTLKDFFVFSDTANTEVWGYNGERRLAAGIMSALNKERETVCLTGNHGEIFYDYEFVHLLDDAGYNIVSNFDLSVNEIPKDCSLIITYNPSTDLDNSQGIEENKKLDRFLEKDGNSYLVFISNATPTLKNLESYLGEWGVATSYHTDVATGKSYRYTVQDTEQSLTSDGYTIYGQRSVGATQQENFSNLDSGAVFKNTTALTHANAFISNGNGTYSKGDRTMYSIYESASGAVLWANGIAASGDSAMLMTMTEQKNSTGGVSYVSVVASVDFVSQELLQTAVYKNPDVMQRTFSVMGQSDTTEGLRLKPFSTSEISTITTAQMLRWTICLTVIPAALITVVGVVILIRRRRA